MPGKSLKTQIIAFRLPNEVIAILERRVKGRLGHWESVGQYLQERIIYDTKRAHNKTTGGN